MSSDFEVTSVDVSPHVTGISQYIKIEIGITQHYSEPMYACEVGDGEKYSGEGIGLI